MIWCYRMSRIAKCRVWNTLMIWCYRMSRIAFWRADGGWWMRRDGMPLLCSTRGDRKIYLPALRTVTFQITLDLLWRHLDLSGTNESDWSYLLAHASIDLHPMVHICRMMSWWRGKMHARYRDQISVKKDLGSWQTTNLEKKIYGALGDALTHTNLFLFLPNIWPAIYHLHLHAAPSNLPTLFNHGHLPPMPPKTVKPHHNFW